MPSKSTAAYSGWRAGDVLRTVLLSAGTLAAMWGLWKASTIVFVTFLGVLFGLVIASAVDQLQRLHVPRGLGAAIVMVGVFAALGGVGMWLAPTITVQGAEIAQRLPDAVREVEVWLTARERQTLAAFASSSGAQAPSGTAPSTVAASGPPATPRQKADTLVVRSAKGAGGGAGDSTRNDGLAAYARRSVEGITGYALNVVGHTIELVAYILLAVFLAIYVATDPELYHRGLTHLIPHRSRARAAEVLTAIATALRRWLTTQLIAMITLGVVWAVALSLLQVRAALALAVIAGFLEFVPIVGPTMAVIPAVGMAVLDSPQKAVAVLAVYLVIQTFEGNVLIPMLMKGRLDLPPAVTIVTQALLTLAFGFLGLMVAVPVTAAVMVAVKLLYVEPVVGDDMEVVETG